MHWRVTSETGMKTVAPSVFTTHSLNLKRFGRRRGISRRPVLELDRPAVELVSLLVRLELEVPLGLHVSLRSTKTPSSFVQKSSVPWTASGARSCGR